VSAPVAEYFEQGHCIDGGVIWIQILVDIAVMRFEGELRISRNKQ